MENFNNKEVANSLKDECAIWFGWLTGSPQDSLLPTQNRVTMDFGEITYLKKYSPEKSINAARTIYRDLERVFDGLTTGFKIQINVGGGAGVIYLDIYERGNPILSKGMLPQIEGFEMKYFGDRAEYHPILEKQ